MKKPRIEDMPDKYEVLNPDGSFRCYGSETFKKLYQEYNQKKEYKGFLSLFSRRKKHPYEIKVDKIWSIADTLSNYHLLIIAEGFERVFINGLHKKTRERMIEETKDRETIRSIYNRLGGEKVKLFSNIELPTEQLTTIGTYGTLLEALKARTRLHSKATHHRKKQGQLGEKSPYKLSVRLEVIDKKTGKNLGKEIWGHDADKVCFSVLARRVNK